MRNGISEGVLSQLRGLNYEFLEILRSDLGSDGPLDRVLGLRREFVARIAQLPDEHVRRLAACPYALFDIRLANAAFWRTVQAHAAPSTYAAAQVPESLMNDVRRVTYGALMYAWHLARTQPLAARLTMGMTQETAEILAGTPIVSFGAVTIRAPGLLVAAHCDNKVLWPDLVHYVANGTTQQFEAAVRLGSQLVAGP